MSKVLYISYDGMLEPLGQSQVLRYLERLAKGHKISLVSFEKVEDWNDVEKRNSLREQLQEAGIHWVPLRYHKRPSAIATAFDIFQGIIIGTWLCLRYKIRIVHARSYVSAVMALALKSMFGVSFIFDMRGFWADERVDGGLWSKGSRVYKVAKWFERKFLLAADCVVSLTQSAIDEMRTFRYLQQNMPRFELITTCADLELFNLPDMRQIDKKTFTLGYVGSVGVWYQFEEVLQCFKILRSSVPDACIHILNRGDHAYIHDMLRKHGISNDCFLLQSANHQEVANAMQSMDAGIFFYKPAYSKKATAPTKLGEFLGCGVPCLSNEGVGDMASIIEDGRVGVALSDFSEESMRDGIKKLLSFVHDSEIHNRCRNLAINKFALLDGVDHYDSIYLSLTERG